MPVSAPSFHLSKPTAFPYALPSAVLHRLASELLQLQPQATAETGCGASTLVFARHSKRHAVFAFNEFQVFERVRAMLSPPMPGLDFIEGPTQQTLPRHPFSAPLDAILLDGPHAFPFPHVEYAYLYPHLRPGGLLLLDDLQIPSVHSLYSVLRRDAMFRLEAVLHRTAFLRRTDAPTFPNDADGWENQRCNTRQLLRYTWRDRLRAKIPKPLRKPATPNNKPQA